LQPHHPKSDRLLGCDVSVVGYYSFRSRGLRSAIISRYQGYVAIRFRFRGDTDRWCGNVPDKAVLFDRQQLAIPIRSQPQGVKGRMLKYGAYQADPPDGEITWFTTNENYAAGGYVRGHGTVPNVIIAESVAALIMRVGPAMDASEKAGQANASISDMDDEKVRKHMADQLTDELVGRLTDETDSIWENNPHWLKHLKQVQT
jgi:hypothetical protein